MMLGGVALDPEIAIRRYGYVCANVGKVQAEVAISVLRHSLHDLNVSAKSGLVKHKQFPG
jgi:hypothetical protein